MASIRPVKPGVHACSATAVGEDPCEHQLVPIAVAAQRHGQRGAPRRTRGGQPQVTVNDRTRHRTPFGDGFHEPPLPPGSTCNPSMS